mgnify:CR=1 FL=1
MPIDESRTFLPVNIAVLTVSDTRDLASDRSGDTLAERIGKAGHRLAAREICKDEAGLIDWSQVTTVIAGEPWAEAPFHAVAVDRSAAVWQALRRLAAMGYRRPGLVLDPTLGARRLSEDTAAHLAHFHGVGENIGMVDRIVSSPDVAGPHLATWLRPRACDVLLAHSPAVLEQLRSALPSDEAAPDLCCLDLEGVSAPVAGVDLRHEAAGLRAMELLIEQVLKNERGMPAVPSITRVSPLWVSGPGLRAQAGSAAIAA